MTKRSKAAYMISAVAEQYQIHPQTLRFVRPTLGAKRPILGGN
jgi:hypothetical protein